MIDTYIKKIEGKGRGLFTNEFIKKGTIIFNFINNRTKIISYKKYKSLVEKNDQNAIRTGCRIGKNKFVINISDEENKCEFINHSFNPSMIYYMGLLIASRDIKKGEELTMDYTYVVAEDDFECFTDYETKTEIKGIPANLYESKSISKLNEILGKTY